MLKLFPYLPREESFHKYPTDSLRLLQVVDLTIALCSAECFQVA